MISVADITGFLRRFAPLELAEEWDNVGLLLGDAATPVERVMTCLTVTPATAAEAITRGTQLLVSHHPVLFRPVQRLTADQPTGRMLLDLIRAGVAVYSPHTAFDNAKGGINDILARRLGLREVQPLRANLRVGQCKIVVFVPEGDLGRVSGALFAAGAGVIGDYRECSYRVTGTGTFHGSEASHPTVGQKGRREEVSEWRLEVLCPAERVPAAVRALRAAHSYEEPAFDIYPLHDVPGTGAGRIGVLAGSPTLGDFATLVRQALSASVVQVLGKAERRISKVAIVCGSGGELLHEATRAGADVFLTGELRYHDQLAAESFGLALVLPGHHATERPGVEELAGILQKEFPTLTVWPSAVETEPLWLG